MYIELQNEHGDILKNSDIKCSYIIAALWKYGTKEEYPWLWAIDPYGDTTFNVHQSPQVVEELKKLLPKTKHKTARDVIEQTIDFMGKTEQHQYIKFIGD